MSYDKAKSLIKKYEGLKLTAYKDAAGVLTVGYGHTGKDVKSNQTITESQAEKLLEADMQTAIRAVEKLESYDFSENQRNALVSFCFNCGAGNLTKLVAGRTKKQISAAILLYNKAGGKTLTGLTARRREERNLFDMTDNTAIEETYITLDIEAVGFAVKDNYRIRKAPSTSGEVIAFTDSSKKARYAVIGINGDWILTDKGYIHKDAFYDSFTGW